MVYKIKSLYQSLLFCFIHFGNPQHYKLVFILLPSEKSYNVTNINFLSSGKPNQKGIDFKCNSQHKHLEMCIGSVYKMQTVGPGLQHLGLLPQQCLYCLEVAMWSWCCLIQHPQTTHKASEAHISSRVSYLLFLKFRQNVDG